MTLSFRLKVRQVEQTCVFDLLDPEGQECAATLKFPDQLTIVYQTWRRIYQKRYQLNSRAKVRSHGGSGTPPTYDWDRELNLAETALLQAFDHWLGQPELLEIRARIQRSFHITAQQWAERTTSTPSNRIVNLFLECTPLELARLPWETWNLAPKDVPPENFRILRTVTGGVAPVLTVRSHRNKARILVILGDAPDLKPEYDQQALRSLAPLAELEFVQCQLDSQRDPQQAIAALKQRVATAISDERGWDGLVFVGHSDESPSTGGKLELAIGASLSIWEIEPQLTVAIQRGLRLAIFNSCSGLQIAEALIRLGMSQVLVMRESIQDQVAHMFLKQLCQQIAHSHNVNTAVQAIYQYFLAEQISYPSAYLIPSLFCHPDPNAAIFQIEPSRLKRFWQQWQLTRWDAIALGTLSLLSLTTPVRELLLDNRYWMQAAYRQITHQQNFSQIPPVTVVSIDQASIQRNGIDSYKVNPMDRAYLAKLITRLQKANVRVIGIDYFLDGATKEDANLFTVMQSAIKNQSWIVLATKQDSSGQVVNVNQRVADLNWILQGDTLIEDWNLMRPAQVNCQTHCPFAYQLALASTLQQNSQKFLFPPHAENSISLQQQVSIYLQQPNNQVLSFFKPFDLPLGLTPILDFSLSPEQAYQKIAAWDLLERPIDDSQLRNLAQQVVIIASGGYDQADDKFPQPLAIAFWQSRSSQPSINQLEVFPGGEAHAYAVHHWLTRHRLIRIPDLWLLITTLFVVKVVFHWQQSQSSSNRWRSRMLMGSIPLFYGAIVLQTYITAGILMPWFFPSILFWSYFLRD